MADCKEIPSAEDSWPTMEEEAQLEESLLKKSLIRKHVKSYLIIDQSDKTPREFGLFSENRKFDETATTTNFIHWEVPWEGQTLWKEPEVRNLDGSPVFCGYFFANLEEFYKDPKASMARLLNEKGKDQLNPL